MEGLHGWTRILVAAVATIVLIHGGGSNRNTLSRMGFPANNINIAVDENPWNLKGKERFVKASLTLAQARVLRKAFRAQLPAREFEQSTTPKDIQPLAGNSQWSPQKVKKYWGGRFQKKEGNSTFHCRYIFDTSNLNNIVLYFYAVTFDA